MLGRGRTGYRPGVGSAGSATEVPGALGRTATPSVVAGPLVPRALGALLGVVFLLVGKVRGRQRRALHPTGRVLPGVLHREGAPVQAGVPWLDEPGTDDVVVRLSRATGLPEPLPDVLGMALRVPVGEGGHGDLLLSSTGTGRASRFLLRPVRHVAVAYTSLFAYRTTTGPLLLAATPLDRGGATFALAWARPTGTWQRFATLTLARPAPAEDTAIAFYPVEHPVPGLPSYRWAAALRRAPYAASRRARGASGTTLEHVP